MARIHYEIERPGKLPEKCGSYSHAWDRAQALLQAGTLPFRIVEVERHKGGQLRRLVRVFNRRG